MINLWRRWKNRREQNSLVDLNDKIAVTLTYPPGVFSVRRIEAGTISLVFSNQGEETFSAKMTHEQTRSLALIMLSLIDEEGPPRDWWMK